MTTKELSLKADELAKQLSELEKEIWKTISYSKEHYQISQDATNAFWHLANLSAGLEQAKEDIQ